MTEESESHEPETTFQDHVERYLENKYGEENVERSRYFSESRRYCDLWVDGPVVDLAIEVESRFSSAFKGVGQSVLYAAHEKNAVPIIVVPEDHVEQPEADMIRNRVPIVELGGWEE